MKINSPTGYWTIGTDFNVVLGEPDVTTEELQSKLLYINNSLIVLLKMKGL